MSKSTNHTMIRVPVAVAERLRRIAAEIDAAKIDGRSFRDVLTTEQGDRGNWTPLHAVITRALDEFEAHRERNRKYKSNRKETEHAS